MHACYSVSVACRPAETRRRHGEIGSVHGSILVGQNAMSNGRLRINRTMYISRHAPGRCHLRSAAYGDLFVIAKSIKIIGPRGFFYAGMEQSTTCSQGPIFIFRNVQKTAETKT